MIGVSGPHDYDCGCARCLARRGARLLNPVYVLHDFGVQVYQVDISSGAMSIMSLDEAAERLAPANLYGSRAEISAALAGGAILRSEPYLYCRRPDYARAIADFSTGRAEGGVA